MKIVIATGAGISAPSGIPVFRGPGGLWTENPELEAKSYVRGKADIDKLWEDWGAVREYVLGCEPNSIHKTIAELEQRGDVRVVTQNIDDLHWRGGSTTVIELHGNLMQSRCVNNPDGCKSSIVTDRNIEKWHCPLCGAPMRPNIVSFGEQLPEYAWRAAESACLRADTYIAVGTSGMVYPAVELVAIAKKMGARTILINKDPWEFPHPDFDETYIGDAQEVLPKVLSGLC